MPVARGMAADNILTTSADQFVGGGLALGQIGARQDQGFDSGITGALHHGVAVGIKLRVAQVQADINHGALGSSVGSFFR